MSTDLIQLEELDELLKDRDGPCVSIFFPTHRVWSETRQDPIRLKNLLAEAKKKLVSEGMRSSEADAFLEPARKLEDDETFWRNQSDGLALFLSRDSFHVYRVPLSFEELVVTGDFFQVKPLLKLLARDGRFFVLALSLENIRLFAGTPYNLSEHGLEDVPLGLTEALRFDEFETQQQFHSGSAPERGGDRKAMYHGQGGAADDANMKKRIVEFFRHVDNGVRQALAEEQSPLVLAGLDHLRGLYRGVNHYEYIIDEGVDGNPTDLSRQDLHKKAWTLIEPRYRQAREEAATAFEHLIRKEPERASDRLVDIVPGAYFRRVKVLFVRDNSHKWGQFDPDSQKVDIHDEMQPGDQDLLDFAVAHTLRNAGTVYLEDDGTMPGNTDAAAIFRY